MEEDYPNLLAKVRKVTVEDPSASHVFVVFYQIQVGDFVVDVFSEFEDAMKALAKEAARPIAKVPETLEAINKAYIDPSSAW